MDNKNSKPCNPEESLKQSLIEMRLMREGEMDKIPYWDATKSLDKIDKN